ncbi:MAG: NUDIX hydrolase [Sphingobacteriales bacterium]|jgi:8-oxo-dGTP pyrophosphatase MutT (NUDIX family)|nr:NUDIX hydrolase [Sphingobacteriales bacterium]
MGVEEDKSHHYNTRNQVHENPWKTLSRDTVYSNPWITLQESKVINPAGNPGIYGVVHFKNRAIAIIPLDEDMHTWIVGQYRYTMDTYEWEVPEGGAPLDEDPLSGAKRELREEVGLEAENWQLVLETQLSNSVSDEIGLTYVARNLREVGSTPEETEVLQVKRLPFSEAVDMVMNGQIKDGLSVASILKVKLMLDRGLLT